MGNSRVITPSTTCQGSPDSAVGKESACSAGDPSLNSWVGKIPQRRGRLPIPVFWPGEFHGLYSPRGRKELDTSEQLSLSLSQAWLWEAYNFRIVQIPSSLFCLKLLMFICIHILPTKISFRTGQSFPALLTFLSCQKMNKPDFQI